jgi:aquaporin Z
MLNPFPGKKASLLRAHWPEYLMEAGELALYMFFTCVVVTFLRHPASAVRHFIAGDESRQLIMGLVMGATATAIVMSPWGQRSGAHFNPAITFTFYRLGKVKLGDALFYASGQFVGGVVGVAAAKLVLRGALSDSTVRYALTLPGMYGTVAAFVAELIISFVLMSAILVTSNREKLARYTPYASGALIALCLSFEAPLSGASMNPARSFGSAFQAIYWHALWIYFIAPTLGMLAAAEVFLRGRTGVGAICAKLNHANDKPCIFNCGYRNTQRHAPSAAQH